MEINERHVGPITVLDVTGRMTLGAATTNLHDKINSLFHQERTQIVLNLSGVEYIDSGGLGELVRTHTSAKTKGGRVCVSSLPKKVHDLLVMTRLVTVFDVHDTEDDAVKSLSS